MIKATNLNKWFGENHILKDINLELQQGDISVLFGPSGCGKTTLLRSLSLLDIPESGELTIFGNKYLFPIKKDKMVLPFPKVTVVFQQLFLWPHLTNKDNILLALDPKNENYKQQIAYFDVLVKDMEMEHYIDKFPNQSSLGQKQRIAIARSLILLPDFIFFDEITASLDIFQINHIIELLLNLKQKSMGFLFITHNIDLAKKIGDKLIYMQNGTIIERGNRDILSYPKTKELKTFLNLF